MPCTPNVEVSFPTPPFGINLEPPDLPFEGDLTLCCKIVDFPPLASILPLPPLVWNPVASAVLEVRLASLLAYKKLIPIRCPKE